MNTSLTSKKTFFIYSLPRSGSTIVAKFFHSLDDGYCWSEAPKWFEAYHKIINVNLVGYKNVIHPKSPHLAIDEFYSNLELIDYPLVLMRHPDTCYASQLAVSPKQYVVNPTDFCRLYETIVNLPAKIMVYERFVSDPIGYVNSIIPELNIVGSLQLDDIYHQGPGDKFAQDSNTIQPTNRKRVSTPLEDAVKIYDTHC